MSRKHKNYGGIIGAGPLVNAAPRTSGVFNLGGLSGDNGFEEPSLELNFDGTTSSFTRATTSPTAAKANGDQLATGIITQNKTGSVQSKYMGPDGKLINGYVENNSPSRNPANTYFVGAGGVTPPTKTTGFTAPDGSNTAVKFTTVQASTYYGRDTTTPVAYIQDENYTISAHFKVLSGSVSVGVLMDNNAFGGATKVYPRAQYYITAGGGAPTENTSRINGPTGFNYGIQDVGDGWYRVWVSAQADFTARLTSPTSQSSNQVFRVDETDVGDEVLIWGLQFEEGVRVPSQFIDASSDQVARVEYGNFRTNLLPNSEDLSSYSLIQRSSVVTNTTVAPDGTTTADSLFEDTTAASSHYARNTISVTGGTTYTYSVYVKANTRSHVRVLLGDPGQAFPSGDIGINVDLTDGSYTGGADLDAISVTSVGNGWWRVAITCTAATTHAGGYAYVFLHNGTDATYDGLGASYGIYVWGAQLEEGSSVTDYIATFGSSRTVGEPLGLLVEEGRANLVPQSTGTAVAWPSSNWNTAGYTGQIGQWGINTNPTGSSLTFTTAPDGTNTAVRFKIPNHGYTVGRCFMGTSTAYECANNATQTVSFWIRNRLSNSGWIIMEPYIDYTVSRKTLYQSDLPQNQWVRVSYSFTNNTGGTIGTSRAAWDIELQSNVDHDFDLWGLQIEGAENATSYIPTNGTALTRTADDITLATSSFGYNRAASSVFVDFSMNENLASNYPGVFRIDDGGSSNNEMLYYAAPASALKYQNKESTQNTTWDVVTSVSQPFSRTFAASVNGAEAQTAIDGVLGSARTLNATPSTTLTTVQMGRQGAGRLNGHIRRFTYWPRAISDASLEAYTSDNRPTELEARTSRRWGGMTGRSLVSGGNVPATGVMSLAEHYQSKL